MNLALPSPRHLPTRLPTALAAAVFVVLALLAGAALLAQVSGERGIAPVASSTDIEVRGIEVNATGETAEEARMNGWREAQRLAWERLEGPDIPDSRLDSLVAAIVVEEENIGPRRYVARLGVIFDRQRAGSLLGADGERTRSAPMLTMPVMISGGTQTMFEVRNPWQRAWAEYQFGSSSIDYVRPSGAGGESLLLTYGQTGRRSRAWWNTILDQFGAADVVVPIANLRWEWPGGPVEGRFTARYGPDNRYLTDFTMRAESAEDLPDMLERAVARFDEIFAEALADGTLRPDPTLTLDNLELTPEVEALLEQARAAERAAAAEAAREEEADAQASEPVEVEPTTTPSTTATASYGVQVATPQAADFDGAIQALRGLPGVSRVSVRSTAIGGASVFDVTYAGELSALADLLRQRGWAVNEGQNALGISR
ncbi:heavy-metal-associated domain-containing protein [Aurantiacibacter poecillastricola]|uniref:heavy-metal-associated domain-containing protein n=1 Tax=Aurantiacibacter poecillastricola TaxID=3064385 RepID=UPI00273EEA0F|nr:heavy-metal-associated domain-containing protein [Aurantiacibacter sp. 219JJ12-13]MDP5262474.1 heavy-metal-associated domain-containing protein [Aurantiacibacter sp. 219JJ12-13]